MSDLPNYSLWKGRFPNKYKYYIYPLPCTFGPEQLGNYIFARVENKAWVPIFIGCGDLHVAANFSSEANCARTKGATHFLAHVNGNSHKREQEMEELLKRYTECYKPNGCNDVPDGFDPSKKPMSRFFW